MVSDRAFIFHIYMYIPWGKSTKVKVKVKVFEKMAILGALVFHSHSLFRYVAHLADLLRDCSP